MGLVARLPMHTGRASADRLDSVWCSNADIGLINRKFCLRGYGSVLFQVFPYDLMPISEIAIPLSVRALVICRIADRSVTSAAATSLWLRFRLFHFASPL
jgi:hypothetical protein